MKKPWYQRLLTNYLSFIIAGIVLVSSAIEVFNNLDSITPQTAFTWTAIVVVIILFLQSYLKNFPIAWITEDGNVVNIKSLGIKPIIAAIGIIIALWLSSVLNKISAPDSTAIVSPEAPTSTVLITPTSNVVNTSPTATQQAVISSQITGGTDVSMVLVPSGSFKMGGNDGYLDTRPVHTVYLTDFYIDEYEVTNAHYYECVTQGICQPPKSYAECKSMGLCSEDDGSINKDNFYKYPQYANQPVVYVDWTMAKTYCEWRGGWLPTEAQWEKAARGIDERKYPWGNDLDCTYANYWSGATGCVGDTTEVGKYEIGKSPYGAYDFAGNVWEWVFDWYDETYYSQLADFDIEPIGPNTGIYRGVRGGSWANVDGQRVSSTLRGAYEPWYVKDDIGIRCGRWP
jgi:eukaryotic-like serine/threonine-protein kinase